MVGLIQSVKETATRIDYEISDLTGPPLEVKQFVDNDVSCIKCFMLLKIHCEGNTDKNIMIALNSV